MQVNSISSHVAERDRFADVCRFITGNLNTFHLLQYKYRIAILSSTRYELQIIK